RTAVEQPQPCYGITMNCLHRSCVPALCTPKEARPSGEITGSCEVRDFGSSARWLYVLMLLLVTGFAHGNKPLDWLFADIPASILFVVHLCGTHTAIHATIVIALQY